MLRRVCLSIDNSESYFINADFVQRETLRVGILFIITLLAIVAGKSKNVTNSLAEECEIGQGSVESQGSEDGNSVFVCKHV